KWPTAPGSSRCSSARPRRSTSYGASSIRASAACCASRSASASSGRRSTYSQDSGSYQPDAPTRAARSIIWACRPPSHALLAATHNLAAGLVAWYALFFVRHRGQDARKPMRAAEQAQEELKKHRPEDWFDQFLESVAKLPAA